MDAAEALVAFLSVFFGIFTIGVSILFFVLAIKFLLAVPRHLKDIADSLEKIANK